MMSLTVTPSVLPDPKTDPESFWSFLEGRSDIASFPGTAPESFTAEAATLWRLGHDRSLTVATDYVLNSQTGALENALTIEKLYIVQRGYVQYGDAAGFQLSRIVEATTRPDGAVTPSYEAAPGADLVIYDIDASSLVPSSTTEIVPNGGYDDSGQDYVTKITQWYDDYVLVVQAAPVAGSGSDARLLISEGNASEYRQIIWGDWLEGGESFTPPAQTLEEIDLPAGWTLTVNGYDDVFGLNRTVTLNADGAISGSITKLVQETAYAVREVGATAMERSLAANVASGALAEWREAIENDQTIVDALASLSANLPDMLYTISQAMAQSGGAPGKTMNDAFASFATAYEQAVSDATAAIAARLAEMPLPTGATAGGMTAEQVRASILNSLMSANLQMVVDQSGDFARIYVNTGGLPTRSWDLSELSRDGYGFALGGRQSDQLYGSDNDDLLIGGAGQDTLQGNGGDDLLIGGAGADQLIGQDGTDTVSYASATSGVTVNLRTGMGSRGDAEGDQLSSIEIAIGSAHDDILTGTNGNNTLIGNAGDDVLQGGAGADRLEGRDGRDTASYAGSTAGVEVDLLNRTASGGDAEGDQLSSIENLTGSNYSDVLTGIDGSVLDGGAGDDTLKLSTVASFDVRGGAGHDTLVITGKGGQFDIDLETMLPGSSRSISGVETVIGRGFSGVMRGDDSENHLVSSSNVLEGRGGADILESPRVSYYSSPEGVTVDLSTGVGHGGDAEGDTLIGVVEVRGSQHDDIIIGSDAENILIGFAGDDILRGGRGNDTLDGREGMDTVSYADATSRVAVSLANQYGQVVALSEEDRLLNIENAIGSDFNDSLNGTDGANVLVGGVGDDKLYGGGGDDILQGGPGADELDGGEGIDTVSYENAGSGVHFRLPGGYSSGDDLIGDVLRSIENVIGSGFDDTLNAFVSYQYDANENSFTVGSTLQGLGGNDILRSNMLADVLDGGDGVDTASYQASPGAEKITGGVRVSLLTGQGERNYAEGDRLISIENLEGTNFKDMLQGDHGSNHLFGAAGDDLLRGEGGADVLDGGDGIDIVSYFYSDAGVQASLTTGTGTGGDAEGDQLFSIEDLTGSAFNDRLEGDARANTLTGGGGNDLLRGQAGADILDGQAGNDSTSYIDSTSGVQIDLAAGTGSGGHAEGDQLISIENTSGSQFNDVLNGTAGSNFLNALDGNDVLRGRGGADRLDGGAGIDTASYFDSVAAVSVDLATGLGSGGDAQGDRLINIESLSGSAFNDVLRGDAGANKLLGFNGADILDGRGGDDEIHGRNGADVMTGGAGSDRFVYLSASDSTFATTGRDRITDFSQSEGDVIDLRSIDADVNTAGNQVFTFIGSAGYSRTAGELRLAEVSGGSLLYGDLDGDGRSEFAVMLTGVTDLTAAAFLL